MKVRISKNKIINGAILRQYLICLFYKIIIIIPFAVLSISLGCKKHQKGDYPKDTLNSEVIPVYTYKIINTYPHAVNAFTQGLVYDKGFLFEGTGIYGRSTLRKVNIENGEVLQFKWLPSKYFGEGITIFEDKILQLTWKSNTGFVYDKESFELIKEFNYTTEGWGITHDGKRLIMSDGTSMLYFLDPKNFKVTFKVEVTDKDGPVNGLNELEYVQGEIFANVWPTWRIVKIDINTGRVTGWINLKGILNPEDYIYPIDVLNGIAYDKDKDRLFITGKMWPMVFEIKLILKSNKM